jgi:release factor glutamine methyltransferase
MADAETWTVGRLLTWTTDFLKQHHSSSPRLDAELLLAEACGCERIGLYTRYEEIVSDDIRQKFRAFVKQRSAGMPVAYLLGRREFYSLNFRVTPDVLIPRPETEFAVVAVLDRLKQRTSATAPKVCDVGTGSGCIAIAVAKHAAEVQLTVIDKSSAALAIARENAAQHQVAERIVWMESDLLAGLTAEAQFDVIVSNPPYISEPEFAELSPEVRDQEPRLALVGGNTGTEVIARLVPQAAEHIISGGWLIMEISPMIAAAVQALIIADSRWEPPSISKDLAGLQRIVQARRL